VFDKYPADTSWEIEALADGFIMAKSPLFDEALKDYESRVCLPDGNYAFSMMDVYSDGMCCNWGEGTYEILSDRGYVIATGGEYGERETTKFTMPFDKDMPFNPDWTARPTPPPTSEPTKKPKQPKPTPKPTAKEGNNASPPVQKPTPPPQNVEEEPSCYMLDVLVNLDNYPPDTTWEIRNQGSDEAFYNSIPYEQSMADSPETQSVCLPKGTYDFIIYDVYGDGM
jgi:hypothetical protein